MKIISCNIVCDGNIHGGSLVSFQEIVFHQYMAANAEMSAAMTALNIKTTVWVVRLIAPSSKSSMCKEYVCVGGGGCICKLTSINKK